MSNQHNLRIYVIELRGIHDKFTMHAEMWCYSCFIIRESFNLKGLQEVGEDSITYKDKLAACIPNKLEVLENMTICLSCIVSLNNTYSFISMVKRTQELIKLRFHVHDKFENDVVDLQEFELESVLKEPCVAEAPSLVSLGLEKLSHLKELDLESGLTSNELNIKQDLNPKLESSSKACNSSVELKSNTAGLISKKQSTSRLYFCTKESNSSVELLSKENNTSRKIASLNKSLEVCIDVNKGISETDYQNYDNLGREVGNKGFSANDRLDHICSESEKTRDKILTQKEEKHIKQIKDEKNVTQELCCEYCCEIFDKKWKLKKHINRIHSEKKYVCSYENCNKAFKQSYHLKEHFLTHTSDRKYTCNTCDKSFQRVSTLNRHMLSHERPPGQKSKRKPFLCTVCGKIFDFANGGQRHMRTHLGVKNHECSVCYKRFTQSTHLWVHMRTHTGEKPYVCHNCGDAFNLNHSLQKHIKSSCSHRKNRNTSQSEITDTLKK